MPIDYSDEFKAFLEDEQIDQQLVQQAVERRSGLPVKVNKVAEMNRKTNYRSEWVD